MDSTLFSNIWPAFDTTETLQDFQLPAANVDFYQTIPAYSSAYLPPAGSAASLSLSAAPSEISIATASTSLTEQTKPIPACSACRTRRVKCVRQSQNEDEECVACRKKGIRCLPAPKAPGKRKYANRSGHRIEAAKAQCGLSRGESSVSPTAVLLSPHSAASQLASTMLSASFCSSLVDEYCRCSSIMQPCVNHTELRYRLSAVSYRPSELAPSTQALLAAIIAIASRITTHQSVTGLPSSIEASTPSTLAQSQLGERRDAMSQTLAREALQKLGESSVVFTATPETIGALHLLGSFSLLTDESKSTEARHLTALATSHLRHLHENAGDLDDPIFDSTANFTLCVTDAMFAIKTGRSLQLTDRDLALFLSGASYNQGQLNLDSVIAVINDPGHVNIMKVAQPMWSQTISLARYLVSSIMDTLASRLPLNVTAVYTFWRTYDSIWHWMEAARALLEKDSFIAQHVELARCCMINLSLGCYRALRRRSGQEAAILLNQAEERVQQAAIAMAEHFEILLATSTIPSIVLATSCQLFQSDLDEWILHLRTAPSLEEGGPVTYPMVRKIQLIDAVISICKALSFSWPGMGQRIAALTAYRSDLQIRNA